MPKAVSPVPAGVLLIAVTVGIGTLTAGFVSTTFQSAESTVTNRTTEAADCSSAEIVIDDAFAKTGDNGTVAVPVRNSGFSNLQITSAQLYDRLGNNFSAGNMPVTGFSKGSIVNLNFQMPKLPNTTVDLSGLGNNGTCGNMSSGNLTGTCRFTLSGKSGSAMDFDGVNDYVDFGNSSSLNISDAITVEGWLNSRGVSMEPSWQAVVSKWIFTSGQRSWWLGITNYTTNTTFIPQFLIRNSSDAPSFIARNETYVIESNTQHHLAGTYNGSLAKLYLDGDLVAYVSGSGPIEDSPTHVLAGKGDLDWFNGMLDDIAVWNRSLNGSEINSTMLSGVASINTTGLVGYWKFDEGKGVLMCSDFSQVLVTTNCGGISAAFGRMPRCS